MISEEDSNIESEDISEPTLEPMPNMETQTDPGVSVSFKSTKEQRWELGGILLFESEIIQLILNTEKDRPIDLLMFSKFFCYHMLHMVCWPVALIVIFIAEGFTLNPLFNMCFLGFNTYTLVQTVGATIISVTLYLIWKE